jgi:soluble lytic murein transglycosylase
MRNINFEPIQFAKMTFIASAMMLPAFVNYNRAPNLTTVDHAERLQYARQVLSNKEYLAYAFKSTENGEIESYIVNQFEKAFPQASQGSIYAWVNTLINEANRAGLDPLFVVAIIQQESRFKSDIVGRHGEIGLMQIRPKTAEWIAKKSNVVWSSGQDLFNPDVNIKIGILYLSYLNKKFKNAQHSTAAYNMGPRNVKRIIASNRVPTIYHSQVYRHYKSFYKEISAQKPSLVVAYQ